MDIQEIKKYNTIVRELNNKLVQVKMRKKMLEEELDKNLKELSSMLNVEITLENFDEFYAKFKESVEKKIAELNKYLAK